MFAFSNDTWEIAGFMEKFSGMENVDVNELEQAIYDLQAIAANKYNSDYWRTFCKCLDKMTSNFIDNMEEN